MTSLYVYVYIYITLLHIIYVIQYNAIYKMQYNVYMYIYMYIDWADLGWLYAWARMGLWRRMLMSWNWHMQLMLRCKLNGAWPGDDLGPKMGVKCISIWRGGGVEVLYIYMYIYLWYTILHSCTVWLSLWLELWVPWALTRGCDPVQKKTSVHAPI